MTPEAGGTLLAALKPLQEQIAGEAKKQGRNEAWQAYGADALVEMAKHPNIRGVKDAKGDLAGSSRVIAESTLAYYSGDDAMTLPLLSVGAVGVVGTSTHFTGRRTRQMIEAWLAGRHDEALALHQALLPVFTGVFATQGVMLVKAGLRHQGFEVGGLRAPLPEATEQEAAAFAALLDRADL